MKEVTTKFVKGFDNIELKKNDGSFAYGSYSVARDIIFIAKIRTDRKLLASIYFHEVGHATGAIKRLNRRTLKNYIRGKNSRKEEYIAELVSDKIIGHSSSRDILLSEMSWLTHKEIEACGRRAEEAIKYIKRNPELCIKRFRKYIS